MPPARTRMAHAWTWLTGCPIRGRSLPSVTTALLWICGSSLFRRRRHAGDIRRRYWLTRRRFNAVNDLVEAADWMADRWAESDAAVRRELWSDLHHRTDDLAEIFD